MKFKIATLMLVALTSWSAAAYDYTSGSLRLHHPVAEPTTGNQQATGVYIQIENDGASPDRLLRASAAIAESVSIHKMDGGAGNMADAQSLAVPAKGRLVLAPGGSHIMLMGLKRPLKDGDRFPLRLVFERAGTVLVDVDVNGMTQKAASAHHH